MSHLHRGKTARVRDAVADRAGGEDGASLMLVIIFVMVFSLIGAALVDIAGAGFRTTTSVADVRDRHLQGDAAVEAAINAIRGSAEHGKYGDGTSPCVADSSNVEKPFYYDPSSGKPLVMVTCSPLALDGTVPDPGSVNATKPKYTVLTLGPLLPSADPTPAKCQGFVEEGNTDLTLGGTGIFSNQRIAVGSKDQESGCAAFDDGSQVFMHVNGDARAVRRCTPHVGGVPSRMDVIGTGDVRCAPTPGGLDPEPMPIYPTGAAFGSGDLDASNVAKVDPPADCGGSAFRIVRFSPGVYSEHPGNHAAAAGCAADTNNVWWFSPGVYYFDFPDSASLWDVWGTSALTAKNIVGGTLRAGLSASSLASAVTIPGACDPGEEGAPNPGVQFIFGGTTRLQTRSDNGPVHRGDIELCAQKWPGTNQRIVVYGLYDPAHVRTSTPDVIRQATPPATTTGFTNPDNAVVVDAPETGDDPTKVATASFTGPNAAPASLTLTGFADVPFGALIEKATIEIKHREGGTHPQKLALSWNWKPRNVGANSSCPSTPPPSVTAPTVGTTMHTDVCDITSAILTGAFPYRRFNDLFSVTLNVDASDLAGPTEAKTCPTRGQPNCVPTPSTPAETATVDVDAIVLKVTYKSPGFQAHRCPTARPTCALIETVELEGATRSAESENPLTHFRGTVYTPTARLSLFVHNGGLTIFQRGVIARTIRVDVSPSATQTDPPFSLPSTVDTVVPPDRRSVIFEARQCSGTNRSDCSSSGNVLARAKVTYTDAKPSASGGPDEVSPGHRVTVDAWIVPR